MFTAKVFCTSYRDDDTGECYYDHQSQVNFMLRNYPILKKYLAYPCKHRENSGAIIIRFHGVEELTDIIRHLGEVVVRVGSLGLLIEIYNDYRE